MIRTLNSTTRLALAGLIAGLGTLGLHASEPLRGLDPFRQGGGAEAPVVASGERYDLHMLRVTVTDGQSLLTGITVSSGSSVATTDASGAAMLVIKGWPDAPLSFTDAEGITFSGSVHLPEGHSEGVDALVFVDGPTGTFEAIAAGETGAERADLAAAWSDLEQSWLAQGIKEDRPTTSRFDVTPGIALPPTGAPVTNGAGHGGLQLLVADARQERVDVLTETGRVDLGGTQLRREASRVRVARNDGTTSLAEPGTDFQKQGWELMLQHQLVDGEQLARGAGEAYEDILASGVLADDAALALGAELLRQGADLEETLAATIRDSVAAAGLDADAGRAVRSVAGVDGDLGRIVIGNPTDDDRHVMIVDGFEPDNTPAACGSIPTNGTPQDRGIDPAGDLDYVCFNLNCGDLVNIETGPIVVGGTGDTHLDLFRPDGLLVASDDDGAATSLWSLITTPIDVTGTYTLRVRGFGATTVVANYRLTVNATPGTCDPTLDDSEPNNTQATCSAKTPDGTYTSHWLRPLGDEDWFCFNVGACGSSIVVDVNEPGDTDITARFRVIAPSGTELLNSTATTAQTVPVGETGTFWVVVSGGSTNAAEPYNNAADQNTGQYDLSINVTPPTSPCDAFEPDSAQAQCNSIAPNGTTVPGHSISPASDADWFCFDLGCNDTVTITVTPTGAPATLRPTVELWGPTSTALIVSTVGATNGAPITLTRTANHAGRWYARVIRASAATGTAQTGTYNISVLATPVPSAACDGFEPDSHPNQCQPPLDFAGTRQSGKTISPLRDEDWICLGNLVCGDTVTVQTYATLPAGQLVDTYIELYKLPNFLTTTDRVAFDDDSGDDQFSLASYTVTTPAAAGTYVAKVRGFSTTAVGSTGPYDVAVTKTSGDCPEPDAFEPDSTQATCTPLPSSALAGHNIFPATDADYYCTSLACGQNLDVTVTPTGGSLRAIVALLDASGAVIQTITAASNGAPVTLATTDNDAGSYAIRVTSSTSTTGNYTISSATSTGTCLFDPFEPDDPQSACRFIGLPRTESRALNPQTDSDFYCFVLDCGDGVNVTVTPTVGNLRAIIRLREGDGTTLTTVTATAAGVPVTLSDAVSVPGQYAIEIDSSSGKGLYDVQIERFTAFQCIDAYEPDNTRDLCQPIATDGTDQTHTLLIHPDEDWVCFDVTECGSRVTAGTFAPNPVYDDADTTVQLYDPDGVMIASATTGGGGSHGRLTTLVNEPGTYAVRIIPASTTATSTSGGQYQLAVTVEDVKKELIVPPVAQTLLPAATRLDAQALTNSSGYTMIPGANPFIDISATGTPLGATGLISHTVAIPFPFTYYGSTYNQVHVQDNGMISFSDPTWIPGIANDCIPDSATPNDFVLAFWEDLQQGVGAAEIYTETLVIGGQQVFITEFFQNPVPGDGNATLEIMLWENGDIEFRYAPTMTSTGVSATVGIENPDGTDGIQYSCNTARTWAGTSLLFSAATGLIDYPDNPACVVPFDVSDDTAPFIDISATGTPVTTWIQNATLTAPDNGHVIQSLPFVFPYFGNFETSLVVHTNGFVSFGAAPTAHTDANTCTFPTPTVPNGMIAAFWDDLNVIGTSAVYTELFDPTAVPGDAYYVIQWNQVPFFTSTGANTFEIILYEDGVIEYRYGTMTASTRGTGNSATIGLEDRTGTSGVLYSCNTADAIADGRRITFVPAVPAARFTWLDPVTNAVLATGPTYFHPIEGICEVLLRVEVKDPIACCTLTNEQLVTIPDRSAPVITTQPSFGTDGCQFLWPPNHGYADFSLADTGIAAFDNCNGVSFRFSSAGSSQPEDESGIGDGGSLDDVMISPDGQIVSLRAERSGNCDQIDRSYTLQIEVVDGVGNVTLSAPFSVCVYHDQGHQPPGPYRGAEPDSDSDDTRPGWTEGTYGTGCGDGCSLTCDPTQVLR